MPREETRWQCQTLPMLEKNPPSTAHTQAPQPQRLGLPKYIHPRRRILTKPPRNSDTNTSDRWWSWTKSPPQKNDIGPCKILILSWKVTPEEKMLRMDSNSIKFPQKILGVSFPISFRDLLSPSPTVLYLGNWESGSLASSPASDSHNPLAH